MIAALMILGLVAGVLAALVGWALEKAAGLVGHPTRWAWAGAIALTLGLVASAPFRTSVAPVLGAAGSAAADPIQTRTVETASSAFADYPLVEVPMTLLRESVDAVLRWAAPVSAGIADALLLGVWVVLTTGLALSGLGLLLRSRCVRRAWPRAVFAGECVKVAPSGAPAVAGLVRPEIVVPRWLISAPEPEQRMAVVHEREHVRAGDPYLLAFGCLAIILLPWNPLIWWMHRRLQVAVEVDCDRRVLHGGVRRRTYASFLIEAAALGRAPLPWAVTLATRKPTLERRLVAMSRSMPRFAVPRALLIASLGGVALIAACEAELPTDAQVEAMDVVGAEAHLHELRGSAAGAITYMVDGVEVSAAEARSIAADEIARIEIMGTAEGDRVNVWTTAGGAERIAAAERLLLEVGETRVREAGEEAGEGTLRIRRASGSGGPETVTFGGVEAFTGLLLIDGERADVARLSQLDPGQIERVEVLKGEAAARLYSEPEAERGVILVTRKR